MLVSGSAVSDPVQIISCPSAPLAVNLAVNPASLSARGWQGAGQGLVLSGRLRGTMDPRWEFLNSRPRRRASGLQRQDVPAAPGVYAFYKNGTPVYVGRALGRRGLRGRLLGNHLRTSPDLSRSTLRRSVAVELGVATRAEAAVRPTLLTQDQVEPVNDWLAGCEVSWAECATADDAAELEDALRREWMPRLNKQ